MFVNLLTLKKLALFSLLQRERLNIRIAEFEIERHRVALDRAGVSRRMIKGNTMTLNLKVGDSDAETFTLEKGKEGELFR